jgi:hypothetical protein
MRIGEGAWSAKRELCDGKEQVRLWVGSGRGEDDER